MADGIPITPPSDLAPPTPPPAASEPEAPALIKPESKEDAPPPPPSLLEVTESEKEEALPVPPVAAEAAVVESEPVKEEAEKKQIPRSLISFKEESNVVADLSDSERKALQELKQLVQEALNTHQFTSPKAEAPAPTPAQAPPPPGAPVSKSESESKPTHEPKIEEQPLKEAEEVAKETAQSVYGGLSVDYCDCNPEFTIEDPVADVTVKPATKQTVEIIIYEKCTIVWELRVVGWEVSYGAEFVPNAENGYTIIVQKATKMSPTDEPVVSNSFKVTELGKILLKIDNPTPKKKRLLYRFKVEPLDY
ncbi:hypothetical protein C1H46_020951 [Malus baccata]|uniref:GOLD domain-containing protein n=1 Tax=Malus baccata TaxID=106549 RepID=A0A540M4K6_MALBA|nr:hypothetical protein C1H46_020951 [Malus baccata]